MVQKLKARLSLSNLTEFTIRQIDNMWQDGDSLILGEMIDSGREAYMKLEHCLSYVSNKYYNDGENINFSHTNGDQYAIWLYLLSNTMFKNRLPTSWCEKVYLLNKALHGCDIFYEVELPSVFLLVHPLGSVLGRAKYSDYLIVYHGCSIGSNHNKYPQLGRYLTLRPGSGIYGNCLIGENVTLAAKSYILDKKINDNNCYIGTPKSYKLKNQSKVNAVWFNCN